MMHSNQININFFTASVLTITSFIILVLAFAPFIFEFAEHDSFEKYQLWADYGGYLGGTLGPALSVIAFIVICRTYLLQQSQHEFNEKQASINLLNEQINFTSNALDDRLNRPYEHNNKIKTLQYILRDQFMTGIMGGTFYNGENNINEIVIEDAIREVESLLELLTIYIEKQKKITNDEYEFTLVNRRFASTISYIEANKTLKSRQSKIM
ncbi:hypothetical protein HNP12_000987 [Aeromonas hydrophila]|uniref:hypothetical protein n=1 Tax=Aeromonas hydrophila TaxID=644 RepID=UPI0021691635|nr:hypothetical protein [Aeromonas hydrophila]MCS3766939.1 hypothetical protein [Aeromonas hydrophila]MCS3793086.1 hypothetical protein [Aeromonas hydrophila]